MPPPLLTCFPSQREEIVPMGPLYFILIQKVGDVPRSYTHAACLDPADLGRRHFQPVSNLLDRKVRSFAQLAQLLPQTPPSYSRALYPWHPLLTPHWWPRGQHAREMYTLHVAYCMVTREIDAILIGSVPECASGPLMRSR